MASSSTSPPHPGNSVETQSRLEQPAHLAVSGWDIFLSHSGVQKGFVKGLFKMLSPLYNVFFDITRPSLPLGDDFPPHIFHAVKSCRLALVVLSNEFICSKWPMLELSAFIDAMPFSGVKVLPLFYELSPHDLKDKEKLQEWYQRWEDFASKDNRIKLSSWSHALHRLGSINGLTFKKSEGELAYLHEIVSAIYQMIPPFLKSSHDGIYGRDRLCKVVIEKFEELERKPQNPFANLSKVSLLGVYGFPGSGKTTLCACLCDHFFSTFVGRALHLKLPTDPTPRELLASAKQLLKLSDFGHNREELMSTIDDLSQMHSILKASNLRRSRVFLVIDNISSQESVEAVEAILQVGVGAGSRVMLVARTLEILHPLLNISKYYHGHIYYVSDSMRVPSISEKEAICVLLQHAGGLVLASDYSSRIKEKFSSRHREIIVRVARMCAFNNGLFYLPLALKIIGSQLRSNGMDLGKWERRLSHLDTMVKELREDAVRKIVERSFDNLHKSLKLIFLDVALFMIPYYCHNIDYQTSVELLSFMHECNPETIKRQVKELARLCFLDLGSSSHKIIMVHDVFLEFARSLSDASSMYYCRGRTIGGVQEVTSNLCKAKADLRALILEVDEKCERFDFPAGLLSVKVVVVRKCKSLAALGLAGLTSLVSLFVEDCPELRHVEFDPSHTYSLKSVKWACKDEQLQRSYRQCLVHEKAGSGLQIKQLIKKGWCSMWAFGGYWPPRPLNGVTGLASRLKALQVLTLEGTGITSLGDLSSYWPQLRVLEVLEDRLEEVELGNLPHLKRFVFGDGSAGFFNSDFLQRSEPRMSKKPNLLAGCPELEEVRICKPSCEDGMSTLVIPSPNLHTLWLEDIFYGEPVLPDFTSSAHSLEKICVRRHWVLKRIDFTHQFLRLGQISLRSCCYLAKITGLECLPSLRDLQIANCCSLQAIENLEAVRMLESLELNDCRVLRLTSQGLSTLEFLERISVTTCPNVQFASLVNMKRLTIYHCEKLKSLEGCDKMGLLEDAEFEGCESLELCPIVLERFSQCNYPRYLPRLSFRGCKFASIKAMVGWVLDENVSAVVLTASMDALVWELIDRLSEKPKERMETEQLVETLGVYLANKLPALTHDHCFDFGPWVEDLKETWRIKCSEFWYDGQKPKPSFPREMERLMEGLGRVPLKRVLQQCQSDAQFRTSVGKCLLEIDSALLSHWISRLRCRLMALALEAGHQTPGG